MVIEKPFGRDLASALELNRALLSVFDERQVFRIDHYLGKETVQNMLVLRFANGIFEPIWNRDYIDHVQITAAEDIGVGTRAGYYDQSGALRDIVQNHMLQLLTLLGMEPPVVVLTADAVRDEKVKVLQRSAAVAARGPDDGGARAVRARRGRRRGGARLPRGGGRRRRTRTPRPTPRCELFVDNWRWAGVPFYLRTGKRLARKVTEIAVHVQARAAPRLPQECSLGVQPNQLILTVQPDEGVSPRSGKDPGLARCGPAGEHGVPLRHRRSCPSRPRPTSG